MTEPSVEMRDMSPVVPSCCLLNRLRRAGLGCKGVAEEKEKFEKVIGTYRGKPAWIGIYSEYMISDIVLVNQLRQHNKEREKKK
jgi:hypothetical protein